MRKKLKRTLSLVAVLAMVLPMLFVTAFAVEPVAGLSITDSEGNASLSNGTVTITVSAWRSVKTNTVTIINNSTTNKARITFDYNAAGDLNSISGTDVSGNSGSFDETLEPEGTCTISFSCTKSGILSSSTATLVLSNFTYKEIGADTDATITYSSTLGSVTAAGAAISDGGTVTLTEAGVALSATPKSGAQFVAWVNGDTNELISTSASFTMQPITGLTKVKALFEGGTTAWYLAGGTNLYSDFAQACTFASTSDTKQVVLLSNGTMPTGEHTVPSGVTFLIPYSNSNFTVADTTATDRSGLLKSTWANANVTFTSDYNDDSGQSNSSVAGVMDPGDPYRTLTIGSSTTLNVAGRMVIGGTIVGGTSNTRGICGGTAAAHANVQLNGTLNVTGTLSCCGYILGNGTLNIANGGNVYQPFTLMDHRDGHYAANSSGDNCFPFNRFTMNNIQCPISMVYGARMYGYINVFTQPNSTAGTEAQHNVAQQLIIGTADDSQCLIKLASGASMALTYDANSYVECASGNAAGYYKQVGRTNMTITGGATFGYMQISVYVPILGNQTSNSASCIFSVPYNYDITLKAAENSTATYTLSNSLMLLPGATMTVESGAELVAAKGSLLVFDGLRDYAHWGTTVTIGSWTNYHYPSTSDLQAKGTLKSNGTANLIVDGTLTINSGVSFGGYVQTNGVGTIKMNGTPSASAGIGHIGDLGGLYGYAVNDQAGRTERTLSAMLYQTNGGILTMNSGNTYYGVDNGTHNIATYAYKVYTDSSNKSTATTVSDETLNANITGSWAMTHECDDFRVETINTSATCTTDGEKTLTCSVCGDTKTETIPAPGHSWTDATCTAPKTCSVCKTTEGEKQAHSYTDAVTAPTCTAQGYTTHTCSACGDSYVDTYVDALNHSFTNYVSDNNATCLVDGTKTAKCDRCDKTDTVTETGTAKGHSFTNYVSNGDSTCQDPGTVTAKCDRCDVTDTKAGSLTDHKYTTYTSNGDATCTADGTKTAFCDYGCGSKSTVTDTGSMSAHRFTEYSYNGNATCIANGTQTALCDYGCNTPSTIEAPNTALGHDFAEYTSNGDATCVEDGTETSTCAREGCNEKDTRADEGSALDHSFTTYVYNNDAACEVPGTKTAKCDRCDVTDTIDDEENPALEHSFTNYVANNDAVCGKDGTKTAVCDHGCGATDTVTNEGSALSHSFTNYVYDENAACGKQGTKTAICGNANCNETDTIDDPDHPALTHEYTNYVSDGNATCTADGTKTALCDHGCGTEDTVADVDSKLGHSFTNYVSNNDATCTADGTETAKCDRCDTTDTRTEENSALDHSFTNYVSDGNAACTEDGTKTAKCDRCDVTDTVADVGSALDHSFTNYVSNDDADCFTPGTETAKCERCDETNTRTNAEAYPALDHSFTNYVSNGDATCTQDGTKTATCERCSETRTVVDEGSKLGHDYDEGVITTEPGCETEGVKTFTCQNDSTHTYTEPVAATGHDYNAIVTEPTCTEGGYTTHTCANCGDSYTDSETEASGHNYEAVVTEPTCTEAGYTTYTCACGDSYVADYVNATGHSHTESVTKAATCTEDGVKTFTCFCGNSYTEVIPATGHTEVTVTGTAATCVKDGLTEGKKCSVCKTWITKQETIPATGEHTYADGKCTGCGVEEEVILPDAEYVFNSSMQANLYLKNEVILNICFKLDNLDVDPTTLLDRIGVMIWDSEDYPGDDKATIENCTAENIFNQSTNTREEPVVCWNSTDKRFEVPTKGIPAKNLGDNVTLRAYYIRSDGEYIYSKIVKDYSPKKYCYNQLKKAPTDDDAVMIAILNYGAAAQKYFNHNVDNLMNSDLTAEQQTITWDGSLVRTDWAIPAEKEGTLTRNTAVIKSRGANLTLKGAINNTFYIKTGANVKSARILVWTEDDYNELSVLTPENATDVCDMTYVGLEDGLKRYEFVIGRPAKDMFSAIYTCAVIEDTSGNVSYGGVLAYCPERFAAINYNTTKEPYLDDVAKTIVIYGDAARRYFYQN